jgi:hypothetical protein
VSDVIQRCLSKSPALRYSCAEDLIEDLRASALDPERQGSSLRTKSAEAVGVLVSWTDEAAPSETAASSISEARLYCETEGWMTAWAGDRAFLAAAPSPSRERAAVDLRARAARLALKLTEGDALGASSLSARVHAARAVILFVQSMPQIVGGDLLGLVNEPAGPAGAVLATAEALRGIEGHFDAAPGPPDEAAWVQVRTKKTEPSG